MVDSFIMIAKYYAILWHYRHLLRHSAYEYEKSIYMRVIR